MEEEALYPVTAVKLSDYTYEQHLLTRLTLSKMSHLETSIIEELIYASLETSIGQLAEELDICIDTLRIHLSELKKTQLFQLEGEKVYIDKKIRRLYEVELLKFNSMAGIDYLQESLQLVPISILPDWYFLSPHSQDLFQSIVEKYFRTPNIYSRYLKHYQHTNPHVLAIKEALFKSKTPFIKASALQEKLQLDDTTFEEALLTLEFGFVLTTTYKENNEKWERYLSPFNEWFCYLKTLSKKTPKTVDDTQISPLSEDSFTILQTIKQCIEELMLFSPLPLIDSNIRNLMKELLLITVDDENIFLGENALEWRKQSFEEQALQLLSHQQQKACYQKDFGEREKMLARIAEAGWVAVDEWLKSCIDGVGENSPVHLTKKGKRWFYQFPTLTTEDVQFIESSLFDLYYSTGMIEMGKKEETLYLQVTPFGKKLLRYVESI